eukprot:3507283-Pleurochrysis_carterae.AAC.1
MFAEHMRQRGSRRPGHLGEPIRAGTVQDYAAAIRIFRSREARQEVVPAGAAMLLPMALKRMREEDGPTGKRRLSRAFRASHFAKLAAAGYDRSSRRGVVEWAAALLAHNLLLRGGEIERPQTRKFDATRGITWASIQ